MKSAHERQPYVCSDDSDAVVLLQGYQTENGSGAKISVKANCAKKNQHLSQGRPHKYCGTLSPSKRYRSTSQVTVKKTTIKDQIGQPRPKYARTIFRFFLPHAVPLVSWRRSGIDTIDSSTLLTALPLRLDQLLCKKKRANSYLTKTVTQKYKANAKRSCTFVQNVSLHNDRTLLHLRCPSGCSQRLLHMTRPSTTSATSATIMLGQRHKETPLGLRLPVEVARFLYRAEHLPQQSFRHGGCACFGQRK